MRERCSPLKTPVATSLALLSANLMRVWEFDRLGGITSEQFDINQHGLQFVSTILGFLWMNEEELGFDPAITTEGGRRFVTIKREGKIERLYRQVD